jgi:hypothetical protein
MAHDELFETYLARMNQSMCETYLGSHYYRNKLPRAEGAVELTETDNAIIDDADITYDITYQRNYRTIHEIHDVNGSHVYDATDLPFSQRNMIVKVF